MEAGWASKVRNETQEELAKRNDRTESANRSAASAKLAAEQQANPTKPSRKRGNSESDGRGRATLAGAKTRHR